MNRMIMMLNTKNTLASFLVMATLHSSRSDYLCDNYIIIQYAGTLVGIYCVVKSDLKKTHL